MYGYGTLELKNATHARWKWITTGYNTEGEEGGHELYEPNFALDDAAWVTNQLFVEQNRSEYEGES